MEAEIQQAQPTAEQAHAATVAAIVDPNTMNPEKAVSLKEAWQATIDKHGPLTDGEILPERTRRMPNEEAAAEGEAAPEPEKPKAAKAKKPEPEPEAEADEEDDKATPVGVRDLINERRKIRERGERRMAALEQEYRAKHGQLSQREQQLSQAEQRYAPLIRAAQAMENGDFDGIAQALGEFAGNEELKSWEKLNSTALQAMQSPVYKRMRELERRTEAERKERAEQERQFRAQQEQSERARQESEWKRSIADQVSEDEDPALSAMLEERPQLVDMIVDKQRRHYHETGGDVLAAHDAAEAVLSEVVANLKHWHEFVEKHRELSPAVKKLYGVQAAAKKPVQNGSRETATPVRQGAKAKAAPPKNVSHTQAAEASAVGNLDDRSLKKMWAKRIEESDAKHWG